MGYIVTDDELVAMLCKECGFIKDKVGCSFCRLSTEQIIKVAKAFMSSDAGIPLAQLHEKAGLLPLRPRGKGKKR